MGHVTPHVTIALHGTAAFAAVGLLTASATGMPVTVLLSGVSAIGTVDDDAPPQASPVLAYAFTEGTGQGVRNTAGAQMNPLGNYLGNSTRLAGWGNNSIFNGVNVTLTDAYAAGPIANSIATRVQSTASNAYLPWDPVAVPAGNYALSVWVKSNTGSSVDVRMQSNDIKTVATAWTQIVDRFTAVPAGSYSWILIHSSIAGDPFDLSIWGWRLDQATDPRSADLSSFDLVLGTTGGAEASDPTWTAQGLAFNGGQFAFGVSDVPLICTDLTLYVAYRQTVVTDYGPLFGETYNANLLRLGTADAGLRYPTATVGGVAATANLVRSADGQPHILSVVADSQTITLGQDTVPIATAAAPALPLILTRAVLGNWNGLRFPGGDIYTVVLYPIAHDAATRQTTESALRAMLATRGVILTLPSAVWLVEGDSISQYAQWPASVMTALAPSIPGRGFAVSGSTMNDLTGRAASVDTYVATIPAGLRPILVILIGHNDLSLGVEAGFVAQLKAYCLGRKLATSTLKIVIVPVLPSTVPNFNESRNIANAMIAADPSFYDALVMVDSAMWADAAASDTAKYPDGVHPSPLGNSLLAPPITAAIHTLMVA